MASKAVRRKISPRQPSYKTRPRSKHSMAESAGESHAAWYAVARGRKPGLYTTWAECHAQTHAFAGAMHKSFASQLDAEDYLRRMRPIGDGGRDDDEPKTLTTPVKVDRSKLEAFRSHQRIDDSVRVANHIFDGLDPAGVSSGIFVVPDDKLDDFWKLVANPDDDDDDDAKETYKLVENVDKSPHRRLVLEFRNFQPNSIEDICRVVFGFFHELHQVQKQHVLLRNRAKEDRMHIAFPQLVVEQDTAVFIEQALESYGCDTNLNKLSKIRLPYSANLDSHDFYETDAYTSRLETLQNVCMTVHDTRPLTPVNEKTVQSWREKNRTEMEARRDTERQWAKEHHRLHCPNSGCRPEYGCF